MRAALPTSTIREMCELVVDCPHFTPDWTDQGYIVIRNQNIRYGRLDLTSPSFTHEADFKRRIHRARPQFGDIVITREAPMGEVCLVPADVACCLGQRQVLLRPKQGVDPRYLHIALQSPFVRHQIFWSEGTGSTVSNIRIPVLEAIKIPRLGRAESQIASIIGTLDDKIELNRRMNETLEASARALFRDWFVDFGPTRAKAEGRPAYLAPDLWSLFPDRLDDDGVPEGWRYRSIYDFANVVYGAPFASDRFNQNGIGRPMARIRDLSSHTAGQFTDEVHRKEFVIRPGSIVVGMDGEFRAYIWHGVPTLMNQRICAFEPKSANLRGFVWQTIEPLLAAQEGSAIGTTVIHLGKKDIDRFVALCPDERVLAAFGATVEPILHKKVANGGQARTLAAIRDALLPKLMSGELRVREAEALAA